MRTTMFVTVFAFVSLSAAFAQEALAQEQDMTATQRTACTVDYAKFCKATLPGGGRILACLSEQHDKLSDACKKVVDAKKK